MLNGIKKQFLRWIGRGNVEDEIPQKRSAEDDFEDDIESPKKRRRVNPEEQFRIVGSEEFTNPLSTWTYSTLLEPHNLQKMRKASSAHNNISVSNKENAMGASSSAPNIMASRSKEVVTSVIDIEDDEEVFEVTTSRDLPQKPKPMFCESQWTSAVPRFRAVSRPRQDNYDVVGDEDVLCLDLPSAVQFGTGMYFNSDPYSSCPLRAPSKLSSKTMKMPRNVFRSPVTMTDQSLRPSNLSCHAANQSSRAIDTITRLYEKSQFQQLISKHRFKGLKLPMSRSRCSSYEGIMEKPAALLKDGPPLITIDSDAPEREVIDLVEKIVKPTTLDSNGDDVVMHAEDWDDKESRSNANNGEVATTSKLADQGLKLPSTPPTRKPSIEEVFHSSTFYSRKTLVEDVRAKYEQKQREREELLKEAQMRTDGYNKQTGDTLKVIEERLRRQLSLTEVVLEEEVVEIIPQLPELTPEILTKVKSALACNQRNKGEVLTEKFSLSITRHDMSSLAGLNWLNDEVINFYMNLLIERGKQKEFLNVYAFNTFFYPKLLQSGHAGLKRWTRKIDLFAHDLIVIPVHLGVHWCLAVIDFRDKHVRYYDSMGSANNKCLQELLRYLQAESLDKKKCAYSTEDWKVINMQNIPQQMNGSDCGMFSCMFAEYVCRNVPITFTQENMPYFRHKMVYEILTGKLMEFH